jgi:uncharacterized membrane protein YbhN (UPF0104 family)
VTVHSFLLTAAAPGLTRRRAVTVNLAGGAVATVTPFGGAAGLEVSRRMMRSWGVDGRSFAGYAFLVNVWGMGCKLLLPVLAVGALSVTDTRVTGPLQATGLVSGLALVALAAAVTGLLLSPRLASSAGAALDRATSGCLHLVGRPYAGHLAADLGNVRRDCSRLVTCGWRRMSLGVVGNAALQCLLLALCVRLTGAGVSLPEVLAGFAFERTLTIVAITPGGIGVGDLGLVSVLLAFGGSPAAIAAAAVLYRMFVLCVGLPVGACLLGVWVLRHPPAPRDGAGVGSEKCGSFANAL